MRGRVSHAGNSTQSRYGYDKASAIAHRALDENTTLREAALKTGWVTAEEFDRIVDPKTMVGNPRWDLMSPSSGLLLALGI
jgi:aspartate ammonia-lyase